MCGPVLAPAPPRSGRPFWVGQVQDLAQVRRSNVCQARHGPGAPALAGRAQPGRLCARGGPDQPHCIDAPPPTHLAAQHTGLARSRQRAQGSSYPHLSTATTSTVPCSYNRHLRREAQSRGTSGSATRRRRRRSTRNSAEGLATAS